MTDKEQKPSSLGTIGFMIAAIIFAAVAGVLLSQVMESTYSQEPVKPVVVAGKKIPAAQRLRKEDLKVAHWPESSIPAGYFDKIEVLTKSMRVPLIPFVPGEAILVSHLAQPSAGMGIATLIDKDKRAMSIRTENPVTLARLLYPGARVDIMTTIRESGGVGRPQSTTKIVLQNIKVLAVGEDIDPLTISNRRRAAEKKQQGGALAGGEAPSAKEARGIVTLLVDPEEAEKLALARREGKIDIVLRNPKDDRKIDTPGATPLAFMPESEANIEDLVGQDGSGAYPEAATKKAARKGRYRRRFRPIQPPSATPKKSTSSRSRGVVIIK